MEVYNLLQKLNAESMTWDNEAMAGEYPKAALDFLQKDHTEARFRKKVTSTVGSVRFNKSERGMAVLAVTNNSHNLLQVPGEEPVKLKKGTLVIIPKGKAVLEHTYTANRLVLIYSL